MDTAKRAANDLPIVIVGAGLSGLSAALHLEKMGHHCVLIEKDAQVGGKIQTDLFEGKYLLDHGFQVLLPAYSELKPILEQTKIELCSFKAGALLNVQGKLYKIADPLRHPLNMLSTSLGRYASLKDKLSVLRLRAYVMAHDSEELLKMEAGSSLEFLKRLGFSDLFIENFWKPFFSGIFLESDLKTRAGYMLYLYKIFAAKPVCVPRNGVGELARKMKDLLKDSVILTNKHVVEIKKDYVVLESGEKILAKAVINSQVSSHAWGAVTTLYFVAPESPIQGPWLYLNSRLNNYLVNHVAVMTEVSKSYAQTDESLISVNVIKGQLEPSDLVRIKHELEQMFGASTKAWRFLRSYEIPKALPLTFAKGEQYWNTPSQQGALLNGKNLALSL